MKLNKAIFILLAFVILTGLIPLGSSNAQEVEYVPSFGMQVQRLDTPVLQKAEDAGNNWLRYNGLLWSQYQPDNNGQFIRNPTLEQKMIEISEAGMELILVIRGTPAWAQKYPGYFCGPMAETNISDFANFMKTVVQTYSVPPYNVKYFEIWNEQDETRQNIVKYHSQYSIVEEGYVGEGFPMGCWGEYGTEYFGGRYYGKMLKAVYPQVKAANPAAQLAIGGLLMPCDPDRDWAYCNMSNFFEGIVKECGSAGCFDFANFHGYVTYDPAQPSVIRMEREEHWWAEKGGQVEGKLSYVRDIMNSNPIGLKPILFTEEALADADNIVGDYDPAFEEAKADYVVWAFARNIAVRIDGSTWYALERYGWLKSGLLDKNDNPLPAYKAFIVASNAIFGAQLERELNLGSGIIGFEFVQGDYRMWVLFSEDGTQKSVAIDSTWMERAFNLYGKAVSPQNDRYYFTRPLYIQSYANTAAPEFTSAPVTNGTQGASYTYNITAIDADERDYLTITAETLPGWLTLIDNDNGTAILKGTPGSADVGDNTVELLVTDSGNLTGTQSFTIDVANVNDPPAFISKPVTSLKAYVEYRYDITVSDPDFIHGDFITNIESLTTLPSWLSLTYSSGDNTAILRGTPNEEQAKVQYPITLRATDNYGASVPQSFTLGSHNIYIPLILR